MDARGLRLPVLRNLQSPRPTLGVFKSVSVIESLRIGVASKIQSVSLLVPCSHVGKLLGRTCSQGCLCWQNSVPVAVELSSLFPSRLMAGSTFSSWRLLRFLATYLVSSFSDSSGELSHAESPLCFWSWIFSFSATSQRKPFTLKELVGRGPS